MRIETIVAPAVAERTLEHVAATYFKHHSLIACVIDVGDARGAKYI